MGLKRKALSLTAAAGVAITAMTLAGPVRVFAGTGGSQYCEDNAGNDDIPILTTPITLGLQIGSAALAPAGHQGNGGTYVTVCYATSPYGSGPETTGGNVAAQLDDTVTPTGGTVTTAGTGCVPDSPEIVTVDCTASAGPSYTYTPATAPAQGGTYTVTIPVTVCFGTNLTGGCSPTLSGPVNAGSTGVIVTTVSSGAPTGTDTGAGATAPVVVLWLAGIPFTLDDGTSASAGVGTQSVEAHPNSTTPLCVLNGYCPSVPTGAAVAFTGTEDVFSISLDGTTYSYNPGYYCIVDSPGTATC